jgi:hypothetical protein
LNLVMDLNGIFLIQFFSTLTVSLVPG